jgi:hypothetical protein
VPACSGRDMLPALVGTHEGCPYKRRAEFYSADVGPNGVRPWDQRCWSLQMGRGGAAGRRVALWSAAARLPPGTAAAMRLLYIERKTSRSAGWRRPLLCEVCGLFCPQIPSGNRRPPRTEVCANLRRAPRTEGAQAELVWNLRNSGTGLAPAVTMRTFPEAGARGDLTKIGAMRWSLPIRRRSWS